MAHNSLLLRNKVSDLPPLSIGSYLLAKLGEGVKFNIAYSLGCLVVKALFWRYRYGSSILSRGKIFIRTHLLFSKGKIIGGVSIFVFLHRTSPPPRMGSLWEGAPSSPIRGRRKNFDSFASYFYSSRTRKNKKYAEKFESKVKEGTPSLCEDRGGEGKK